MNLDLNSLGDDFIKEFNNMSEEERETFFKVLDEFSDSGSSNTLLSLYKEDFDEIPVSIEEFLHNPEYLGKGLIGEDGKFTVFPYWVDVLKKVFPDNIHTAYRTLVLSGGIGLGKSFVAVLCILYQLYRMMCLKNPYVFYGLQPIDKITFSFMNITLDASKGVAWDKAQQLLQASPWFMARGSVSGRENIVWAPPKGIELIAGSQPRHVIGRAVFSNFCLSGDTTIITNKGEYALKDLVDKKIKVYTKLDNSFILSDICTVKPTVKTNAYYEITLADGKTLKCTNNHKFLVLKSANDGEYVCAEELEVNDRICFTTDIDTSSSIEIIDINRVVTKDFIQFYDVVNVADTHNFLIKTNSGYIVSHNCDEISFIQNQDITKQIEKAKLLISTVDARMQSRFMKGEFNPTLNILASSKRTDQSFLETYIENKRKNESKTTLVIDEPQWVIRTDKDSPNKFWVAVGNKFLESELIPLNATEEDLKSYTDRGYTLLHVPMGYYEQFVDNIDIALTDIAGISTSNTSRYISGVRLKAVKHEDFYNPFVKDVLEIGNAPDDKDQYQDYFDMSKVPQELMRKPLYVHLDMSLSGDKTGIAGTWIIGKKPTAEGEEPSRDLFFRLAFSVSIKAPKGYQVSFEKNRNFIRWLRNSGFNVKGVSYDTYQSADLGQTLLAEGFNCDTISVDRVQNNICIPYQTLKNAIYEERVQIYDDCPLLTEEIIGLERFQNGKIDHTSSGINCFTGDTKVRLVDGRDLTFLELVDEYNAGKINKVFSYNINTGCVESKPILKAWCSGKNAKLLEVTLSNDYKIRCTPEHKFLLKSGIYKEANRLLLEDELMPFDNNFYSIISIKHLSYTEDVYDIEVKDNHNFLLSAGVIVHNSKDQSDGFAGSLYNASLHAEEYAFDFGEDMTTFSKVNSSVNNDFEDLLNFSNQLIDRNTGEPVSQAKVIKDIDQMLNFDSDILVW